MTYDILILGAGPSGLSTALHLAQLAPELIPRILILEKTRHPRPKLCAGGLVADAEVILQRLGLDVREVPHVDASAAHLDFAGKGLTIAAPRRPIWKNNKDTPALLKKVFPADPHILRIVRRDEFDAWLASKVREKGIELREGITVKNVIPRDDSVLVETDAGDFHAQAVVGADGSNGVTRRCVLPLAPIQTARVLEVITPESSPLSSQNRELVPNSKAATIPFRRHREAVPLHGRDQAYFDFFPVPEGIAGYIWDFPTQIKGRPMRCWGVYDANLLANGPRVALKEPLSREMTRHGYRLEQYELKGHPIRWFSPFNQFSVSRVLLVGDAAGADGIFGEGISIALGYGKLAARELKDAFRRHDLSFRDYHQRILMSSLGQSLTMRWLITGIIYNLHWRWFQNFFWRGMGWIIAAVSWIFVLNWGKRMK